MTIRRRTFLKHSAALSAGFLALRMPVIAGPFMNGELNNFQIPEDKKLDPAWVKSLYDRGSATTYLKSKNELEYIGMPVGGINCGTVYLGGDGRLWLWDIFNRKEEGIDPKTVTWKIEGQEDRKIRSRDGSAYLQPAKDICPLQQGFEIRIEYEGNTITKKLETKDWTDISFTATYPIATIRYIDKTLPVEISLQAYSPFIPLDPDDSGLPATILNLEIKNTSGKVVKVAVTAFLENKICLYTNEEKQQSRLNKSFKAEGINAVSLTMAPDDTNQSVNAAPDFGSMCLASLSTTAALNLDFKINDKPKASVGAITTSHQLRPGAIATSNFVISWFFPNIAYEGMKDKGRYYTKRFKNATEVAVYIGRNFKRLSSATKLFYDTWYDSSLPHWFLERTFSNISTLATSTCHRFDSGRFYAWEGVNACPGTCTHVWHYAQAVGRVFPSLERITRSKVDLGTAMQQDGGIIFRGEFEKRPAIDGQAGTILRIFREHQMSHDHSFLQANWPNIKRAIEFVIRQDKNRDGMEDTPMENTLDAVWDGEIAWIVGLCIAAVKAGSEMAKEMKDTSFEKNCNEYVAKGTTNMEAALFNGEYFIHRPDAQKGRSRLGSYNTCHIDQVLGQSWAFQVGLDRIISKEKSVAALKSLWRYNFTPDVGPYIKTHTGGRPYALAGEGGLIMNTNPKNEAKPYGDEVTWQMGYFHECMSGFEHQVASHMMAEGMTDEALVITRMIHDRYHASKRNPFNEIECSDHYARAMASYGTFITACGFRYHGPKGYISFAPAFGAKSFKSPFITAEGWGSYSQQINDNIQVSKLELKYGHLQLQRLELKLDHIQPASVDLKLSGKHITSNFSTKDGNISIIIPGSIKIVANQVLEVLIS